jgi:hypothetical protein
MNQIVAPSAYKIIDANSAANSRRYFLQPVIFIGYSLETIDFKYPYALGQICKTQLLSFGTPIAQLGKSASG